MGADMLAAVCSSPRNLGLDDDQARSLLVRWASTLDREQVECFLADAGRLDLTELCRQEREGDLEDLADSQDEDPELCWGRRFVCDKVMEAYEEAAKSRCVGALRLGGQQWWLAGGMSWGDTPTGYDSIAILDSTGCFDAKQVKTLLALSWSHVPTSMWTPSDPQSWQRGISKAFGDIRVVAYEHGWMLFLGDRESDDQAADWAKPILALARAASCRFINFDTDAEVCEHLHDYTAGTPLEQLANTFPENEND